MKVPEWAQAEHIAAARSVLPDEIAVPPLRLVDGYGLVCESLQVTGSYKVRSICYLMQLFREQLLNGTAGLALASSGNFAVALAWAGKRFGVPVTAVMMRRSHAWKVERVRQLGGRVVFCGDTTEERTAALAALQDEGLLLVDHLTDPRALIGHATLAHDLRQLKCDTLLVPASTGGLLAATAVVYKQYHPQARVIGVQPAGANAMVRSFRSGQRERVQPTVTECDALTANTPGELPWQVAQEWVDDMVEVSESEVHAAVVWLAEEAKLVVEPGGAAALAALQKGAIAREGAYAVLSGGNIAPARLAEWLVRA